MVIQLKLFSLHALSQVRERKSSIVYYLFCRFLSCGAYGYQQSSYSCGSSFANQPVKASFLLTNTGGYEYFFLEYSTSDI